MKHIDSWKKSKETFYMQLERNLHELKTEYPPHWNNFVSFIKKYKPKRIVDIGCGAGVYKHISNNAVDLDYVGYDYSDVAIDVATEAWGKGFYVKDYKSLNSDDILENDAIVCNALCDVLPNGDECMKHILSLGCNNLLIQRVKIDDVSSTKTYQAYDIITYEFVHNKQQIVNDAKNYNYNINFIHLYDNSYDIVLELRD